MNYYSFHIGDYAAHTRHLSPMADLCYRRLLDLYYQTQRPLPLDVDEVARRIGFRNESEIVSEVLSDFFLKSDEGFRNKRCDEEILAYQAKVESAKKAIRIRWESESNTKRIRDVSGANSPRIRTVYAPYTDQIPTNNQEPITNTIPLSPSEMSPPAPEAPAKAKQGELPPKRAKALPDAWEPTQGHRELAVKLGVSLDAELPQFRDHHTAKRSLMADWDAAFRTWLRNAAKWARPAAKAGKAPKVAYLPAEQWDTSGVDEWGLPICPPKNGAPLSPITGESNAAARPRHASPLGDFKTNGTHK